MKMVVCLPAYNEARVLPEVVAELRAAGVESICVINDGSSDDTAAVARAAGVSVVSHLINRGAGAAVQTGIEQARRRGWERLALMDADGQHLPEDLFRMAAWMDETDCDIVVGSRFIGENDEIPGSRHAYNFIANRMTNFFCHRNYTDSQSGLRLLNRRAIEALQLEIDGFGFCSEMLLKAERANLRVEELPTSVRYTDYSRSKGQDLQMGYTTALNFIWNTLFR